jgi:ubiquinone/menaquinone biosynthesis C-methylase UbiE
MKIGKFDSDAAALKQRLAITERYGSADLNEWIFANLDARPGQDALELGPGTGKQTLPLAEIVGERGHVTAVDISEAALRDLRRDAERAGLGSRIRTLHVGMDDFDDHVGSRTFDRVLSSYSLYYARDPRALVHKAHARLKPDGIMFVCGPAKDNNVELQTFLSSLRRGVEPPALSLPARIMEQELPEWARELFDDVTVSRFENRVTFDSAEAMHSFWTSHNLYDEELEADFMAAANRHFSQAGKFQYVKRAVGIKASRRPA